jgi:hypothetical protein
MEDFDLSMDGEIRQGTHNPHTLYLDTDDGVSRPIGCVFNPEHTALLAEWANLGRQQR